MFSQKLIPSYRIQYCATAAVYMNMHMYSVLCFDIVFRQCLCKVQFIQSVRGLNAA